MVKDDRTIHTDLMESHAFMQMQCADHMLMLAGALVRRPDPAAGVYEVLDAASETNKRPAELTRSAQGLYSAADSLLRMVQARRALSKTKPIKGEQGND